MIVSTFSGIGGLELGLERAGFGPTVVQAESDPHALAVLARHWPDALRVDDVRKVPTLDGVTVVCGGFPCQPVSDAGRRLAQDDPRWLWPALADVVERLQPSYLVAENVDGLLRRGLYVVLADLARLGYDVEYDLLPAASVGAPHKRERFFIVAWRRELDVGVVFARPPAVSSWWVDNPERLPRLEHGVPRRRERITRLGNAVVPQLAEHVGRSLADAVGSTWSPEHAVPLDRWEPRDTITVEHELLDLFGGTALVQVESESPVLPWHGRVVDGRLAELPRSFPVKLNGMRLWPTPGADEAEWSLAAIAACVDANGEPARDPHVRHYHPRTGQIVQKGLGNYVLGVEAGLWPTPVASDRMGSRRLTAQTDEWASHEGTTLTDAVWLAEGVVHRCGVSVDRGGGRSLVEAAELLPTPLASDANGSRSSKGAARPDEGGLAHAARQLDEPLLPTPCASDHKGVSRPGQRRGQLAEAVLWPTPHGVSGGRVDGGYDGHGSELSQAVRVAEGASDSERSARKLLPTPKASASGPDFARRGEDDTRQGGRPTSGGDDLATVVARDAVEPGPLAPGWVEWLMGFPPGWTELPT